MIPELDSTAYQAVFEQLERAGVRFVVISGFAVVIHGYSRPLADLDLVIDPVPAEIQKTMQAMMMSGFVPSIPVPLSMLTVLRMFNQDNREVDVFARYHIPFDELWHDSKEVNIGNSVVHVQSLEHLIRAKKTSARTHDLEDVEHLMQLRR